MIGKGADAVPVIHPSKYTIISVGSVTKRKSIAKVEPRSKALLKL